MKWRQTQSELLFYTGCRTPGSDSPQNTDDKMSSEVEKLFTSAQKPKRSFGYLLMVAV